MSPMLGGGKSLHMPRFVLLAGAVAIATAIAMASISARAVQPAATDDAETLRGLIRQTEKAINSHDPDGVMAHYSRDVIVSYPGVPDTTYDQFARSYRQMMNPSITTATVADVQEIVVSGDLASIRMTWSTTITEKASGKSSSRQAKDLQVWRKENGQWKFFRGMWYHTRKD